MHRALGEHGELLPRLLFGPPNEQLICAFSVVDARRVSRAAQVLGEHRDQERVLGETHGVVCVCSNILERLLCATQGAPACSANVFGVPIYLGVDIS